MFFLLKNEENIYSNIDKYSYFFCIDFFFGKKILDFLYTNNIIVSPEKIISQTREIQEKEKSYRIKNKHAIMPRTVRTNIL